MIKFEFNKQGQQACISGDLFSEIREHFSVENTSAHFAKKFNRFAPKRFYAITPTGRFDAPLYSEIQKYLSTRNYTGGVDIAPSFQQEITPTKYTWALRKEFTTDPYPLTLKLHDYQQDIVQCCIENGRGSVILATAGGKTLTIASLISRVSTFYTPKSFKCLVVVPDLGLVSQTYKDFLAYKVPFTVSKWTGKEPLDLSADVIIANIGILQSSESDVDWTRYIDLLIVDEVHKLRDGNEINKLIKKILTPHKFGFTGTMPEDRLDQWNIIGKIGPVLYERASFQLREEKYISDVECQILSIQYAPLSYRPVVQQNEYRQELSFIASNKFRNRIISTIAQGVQNNCLILVDYINHGILVEQACKEACPSKQVYFIRGVVEVIERERINQLIEANKNVVVVAISKIFSTGINIKNLHYIIFAGGGKAKIKTVQSIGRGLRLHTDKKKLVLIDIADQLKYGRQHAEKRKHLYEKERINTSSRDLTEK